MSRLLLLLFKVNYVSKSIFKQDCFFFFFFFLNSMLRLFFFCLFLFLCLLFYLIKYCRITEAVSEASNNGNLFDTAAVRGLHFQHRLLERCFLFVCLFV